MAKLLDYSHNFLYYILYGVGLIVVFKVFKRPIKKVYKIGFAVIMNRVASRYNLKLGYKKERLFSEMSKMIVELNRPIEVLEIGAGSGANFKYYPKGTNIMCVDPNPYFDSYIKQNSDEYQHVNLREFIVCRAEDMSQLLNSSVDAVVCTLVLCSVDDIDQCLCEVKRVLRPGGKFFYMEHVQAESNTFNYKLQRILNPLWGYFGDGCHLTRDTWRNVDEAGFSLVKQEKFTVQLKGIWRRLMFPIVIRPHLLGVATK